MLLQDFDLYFLSYWQKTEADMMALHDLVRMYFHAMVYSEAKVRFLTKDWEETKKAIVAHLLSQKCLYRQIQDKCGPFREGLFNLIETQNPYIYLDWHHLYVKL